jgi:hypothetical protein
MSEDKQFFYANAVEIALSVFDVNLKFMRTGNPTTSLAQSQANPPLMQQIQPTLQDQMVIGMSPQHAKALLVNLTEGLKQYEAQFGALPDGTKLQAGITLPAKH